MVTRAYVLQWYGFTMYMSVVWCFPDNAIGKKYILARSGDGTYALVPDGTKLPGIPVSSVDTHSTNTATIDSSIKHNAPLNSTTGAAAPTTISQNDSMLDLNKKNNGLSDEKDTVTLALLGRDGVNGRPGPKGQPGERGLAGTPGPPGLKGEPGTCRTPQFHCDIDFIKNLTSRIAHLEKLLSKPEERLGRPGNL